MNSPSFLVKVRHTSQKKKEKRKKEKQWKKLRYARHVELWE